MALNVSVLRILLVIGILSIILLLILLSLKKSRKKDEQPAENRNDFPKNPPTKISEKKVPMKGLIESFDDLDRIKEKIRIQKKYVLEHQSLA